MHPLRRISLILFATVVTTTGAVALLGAAQRRPLRIVAETACVARRPGDQALIETLAAAGATGIVATDRTLALTLDGGAEAWELYRLLDEEPFAALSHESPKIRVLAALHLLRERPLEARRLAPLLADDANVSLAIYDDPPSTMTVGALVARMACTRVADSYAVRALLERAAADWRLLALRTELAACEAATLADRSVSSGVDARRIDSAATAVLDASVVPIGWLRRQWLALRGLVGKAPLPWLRRCRPHSQTVVSG